MTMHFLCLMFLPQRPFRLSRSAASNTSLTPLPVFALHSRYPAPISLATAAPCSGVTGAWPCAESMRMVVPSDRRSVLVPIRRRGVEGQKWDTSGYHFCECKEMQRLYLVGEESTGGAGCTLSRTLARLVGKSTENTIRITSLSG